MNDYPKEVQEILDYIRTSPPELISLLYDLDLLPEQLEPKTREWGRMLIVAAYVKSKGN